MKVITDFAAFRVRKSLYVIRSTSSEHPDHYTFGCSGVNKGNGTLAKRIVVHGERRPAEDHANEVAGSLTRHGFYPFAQPIWALDMDSSTVEEVKRAEDELEALVKAAFGEENVKSKSVFAADSDDQVLAVCARLVNSLAKLGG